MTEQAKKIIVGFMVVSVLVATLFAIPRFPRPSLSTENEPSVVTPVPEEDGVMCTMEVKLCPDGSVVGRSGPNCEFAPCIGGDTAPSAEGFERCVQAGNPVMESYPRRCRMEGVTYTEKVSPSAPEPY